MRLSALGVALVFSVLLVPGTVVAQPASGAEASVPRVMQFTGTFRPANGQPPAPVEIVTFAIYGDETEGTTLWQETQNVTIASGGEYTVVLGSTNPDGLPMDVFASGQAHWLGVHVERAGESEQPRIRIMSVPYALRSADADTLGGKPASAYVLAEPATSTSTAASGKPGSTKSDRSATTPSATTQSATTGWIPVATDSVGGLGNSVMFQSASNFIGVGTTTPNDAVHAVVNDGAGNFTGYAVQNLNAGALAYSGMLFYDHTGALTQFQGYNNVTHEYRINNIARVSPGGAFNGSINFMQGGVSKFLVAPTGNIGIGTTSPNALLEVSNALIPALNANFNVTSFGSQSGIQLRRARGTVGAPSAVQAGDPIGSFTARGYGATGFGGDTGMSVMASQNWTDAAQGTFINIFTTPNGSNQGNVRMTIAPDGSVGIGTVVPNIFNAGLDVSNASTGTTPFATSMTSSFGSTAAGSAFVGRKARGTGGTPTAVQAGDNLAGFLGRGYGATAFNSYGGGMFVRVAEDWTDIAQGTSLLFHTTATGTITPSTKMTLDPAGNLGIGTTAPKASLEVSRTGTNAVVTSTVYKNGCCSAFIAQSARGTADAPTAVQVGDLLGTFGTSGYGTTSFNDIFTVVAGFAAENFSDTARGTALVLGTTPLGTHNVNLVMGLLPSGNVGIGTPVDANGILTAADRLQVFGDIRVGTSGTNGCLNNFGGGGIVGTCASDRRFKKNISPFGAVLDQVTALQPVNFDWRTTEFPERHFGDSRAYGLIAQDVEGVLPELVVTNEDGYKAVDYSKLPLLAIQAVKELKSRNEHLSEEAAKLGARVDELERTVRELLAAIAAKE
jgi:hypothetical protein